jgi:hypothetical protein
MSQKAEHRWVLDSVEEGMARLEEDGERMITIPAHLLPSGVTEGQLLRVTRAPDTDRASAVITIAIDAAGTAKAFRKSIETTTEALAESKKRDRGGDVSL